MQNHHNNTPYYFLLIVESLLAFGLGVFGNKVAELFDISSTLILLGTIVLIILAFIVTIAKIRHDKGQEIFPC